MAARRARARKSWRGRTDGFLDTCARAVVGCVARPGRELASALHHRDGSVDRGVPRCSATIPRPTTWMTSGWEVVTAISTAIIALSVVGLVVVVVLFLAEIRQVVHRAEETAGRGEAKLGPLVDRLTEASDNVLAISSSLRGDAKTVSNTIDEATESVRVAISGAEHRLNGLNALLDVAQGEAERLFVTAAAVVSGVRGGAAAFRKRRGTEFASDELEAADAADDLDFQEVGDGHDDDTEPPAQASAPAPRIRPRARSQRRP